MERNLTDEIKNRIYGGKGKHVSKTKWVYKNNGHYAYMHNARVKEVVERVGRKISEKEILKQYAALTDKVGVDNIEKLMEEFKMIASGDAKVDMQRVLDACILWKTQCGGAMKEIIDRIVRHENSKARPNTAILKWAVTKQRSIAGVLYENIKNIQANYNRAPEPEKTKINIKDLKE